MSRSQRTLNWLTLAVVLGVCLPGSGLAVVLTTAVNPANGHTYHLLESTTWTASEAEAITLGGHLVTIGDAAENAWIEATFKPFGDKFWLGYTDVVVENIFVWIDGDPSTYQNWGGAEPNDACPFGPEDVSIMFTNGAGLPGLNPIQDGEWADIPDDAVCGGGTPVRGVVEVTPAPSVPAIAGWGLILLATASLALGRATSRGELE